MPHLDTHKQLEKQEHIIEQQSEWLYMLHINQTQLIAENLNLI